MLAKTRKKVKISKIFVAITSANEKDLKQTVLSAIRNSDKPDDLTFGIFDLCMNGFNQTDFTELKNVIYMPMLFSGTQGIGLARLITSSIIPPDCDYVLQLDSHMLFTKSWDTKIKYYYQVLESKYNKPIISSRCKQWEYDDDMNILIDNEIVNDIYNLNYNKDNSVSKLIFRDHRSAFIQDGYPTIAGIEVSSDDYVEHNLISAQFTFSRPELYSEILHDPRLPWGGDEPIYALRAWTRGYQMFSIKPTICFHYNKKTSSIAYGKHPEDDWRHLNNNDSRLFNFYIKRYQDGQKIMKDILLGNYFGYWGSESLKKLNEFEEACNISFKEFYSTKK